MSNEELAIRIQQGEEYLIPQLWEQVVKFIAMKAREYISHKGPQGLPCSGEETDLTNQAYFGFLEAVKYFNPEAGKFLTILSLSIKTSFAEAAGYRTAAQRLDSIRDAVSGDAPVGEDDFSLFDTIPDGGESVEEQATRELYLHQLRRTLDKAMNELPSQQEMILRAHYYDELPRDEIAKELMCTQSNVGQQEQAALSALYKARFQNGLNEYLEQNTNYTLQIGIRRFKSTGTSAVEEIVLQRERLVEEWMRAHYGKAGEKDDKKRVDQPVHQEDRTVQFGATAVFPKGVLQRGHRKRFLRELRAQYL